MFLHKKHPCTNSAFPFSFQSRRSLFTKMNIIHGIVQKTLTWMMLCGLALGVSHSCGKGESCSIGLISKMPLVKKCNTTMKISKVLLDNRVKALRRKWSLGLIGLVQVWSLPGTKSVAEEKADAIAVGFCSAGSLRWDQWALTITILLRKVGDWSGPLGNAFETRKKGVYKVPHKRADCHERFWEFSC